MDRDGVLELMWSIALVVLVFWLADQFQGYDYGRFKPPWGFR